MRVRLAWLLAGMSLVCAIADTVVTATFRPLLSEESVAVHGWPLATLATVGSAAIGALIVSRYPGHVIGWLLSVVGAGSAISLLAESYSVWETDHGGPGTEAIGHLAGWLSLLLSAPLAFSGLTMMFLLAPDGRLLSRGWRLAGVVSVTGLACWTAGVCLTPPSQVVIDSDATAGTPLASALFRIGLWLLLAAMLASVVSLVIRLRRARGVERQQLRWIALWASTLPFGLVFLLVVNAVNGGDQPWLARMPLMFSYVLLPVCMAVAVLRYRLYDIDLIINRAVVLALSTAFAGLGYVGLVVGVGELVDARTSGFWPSMLASGAVALAFQPLRRGVVRVADRFAYGARAAPYEALADFSRQLGDSPDPQMMLPTVAHAAVQAVSGQHATVRLHIADGADRTATWPADPEDATATTELPVFDHGERLGSISIAMPPGRSLRRSDQLLLADLAGQTALAFRNARLATELSARVELLDTRTAELAQSRARVIEARDAESIRLQRAIRRDVSSHLEPIPRRLAELSRQVDRTDPAPALAQMIKESVEALEALRELTRGIYSTQLARFGLASAISAHLRRTSEDGSFTIEESARVPRFGRPVESAAYFCYVTAVRELQPPVAVNLGVERDLLRIVVAGGPGPAPDLRHLQDRLDPLAGSVTWVRAVGRSVLTITVPIDVHDVGALALAAQRGGD